MIATGIALLSASGCALNEAEAEDALIETSAEGQAEADALPPTVGVGGGQVAMCHLTYDPVTGIFGFEDILVDQSAVSGHLALGDLLGTCASFFCNAS